MLAKRVPGSTKTIRSKNRRVETPHTQVDHLIRMVQRRTFCNPHASVEVPNLATILDNTCWALQHPKNYTPKYLEILKSQIDEAEQALAAVRVVLAYREINHKNPIIYERAKKERSRV